MIESKNPEIDVDELMRRVKEEVQENQNTGFPGAPPPPSFLHNAFRNAHVEVLISVAEEKSKLRTKFPKPFLRFPFKYSKKLQRYALKAMELLFYDQRELNIALLEPLKQLLNMNRELAEQTIKLGSELSTVRGLFNLALRERDLQEEIRVAQARLISLSGQMQTIHSQFDSFEERLGATQALLNETEQQLRASMTRISALVQENAERAAGELQSIRSELHKIEDSQTLLSELGQRGKTDVTFLKDELIRGKTDVTFLKNELILQKGHLTRFLESINGRSTEAFNLSAIQSLTEFGKHSSDALYVAFEDQFRGTREDIKQRISAYLPIIAEAGVGLTDSPILDLGCGRGELLELLQDSGYVVRGVDLNQVMVSLCRERGFDVAERDLVEYLREQPDSTIGAIVCLHVIEHLSYELLIAILAETVRVLKPGGLAIFETPNPENVRVASHTFYLDPTHRNPLPSALVKFLAEFQGLCRVSIVSLHPYPASLQVTGENSSLLNRFNEYFYGPQDYAVIGYKS